MTKDVLNISYPLLNVKTIVQTYISDEELDMC